MSEKEKEEQQQRDKKILSDIYSIITTWEHKNKIRGFNEIKELLANCYLPVSAKPCQVCGKYYPGDCTCGSGCTCDGCTTLRETRIEFEGD